MKTIIISLFIFSIIGISSAFSSDQCPKRPELAKKTIIKKPPHDDDGNGGHGSK